MSRAEGSAYGPIDRLLHRLAFRGLTAQVTLADLEDRLFGSRLRDVSIGDPVFVTSLPRCGTTLLLDLLAGAPEFVCHRYSDMPFVLCPVFWNAVAKPLRASGRARERAHGDGVFIDTSSPESLEEVLWQAFWPEAYRGRRLPLWTSTPQRSEFSEFFARHIRKLAYTRPPQTGAAVRYLSKNNGNLPRISFLRQMLPKAYFVVPFRNPLSHAMSLHRQHIRLGQLQRGDPFAKQYMKYLGHFEFGDLLRLIDFPTLNGDSPKDDAAASPAFWLRYWCRAFSFVLSLASDRILLLDYDALCTRPGESLRVLCERLYIAWSDHWDGAAETIRRHDGPCATPNSQRSELESRAWQLHSDLRARAINART
jgi:sulfotransferase family protein